jgi:hypothetical protein
MGRLDWSRDKSGLGGRSKNWDWPHGRPSILCVRATQTRQRDMIYVGRVNERTNFLCCKNWEGMTERQRGAEAGGVVNSSVLHAYIRRETGREKERSSI